MILVVDVDKDVLRTLTNMIESAGYPVSAASSPKEAITQAADMDSLELLIADIYMPEMDGFELLRELRASQPRLRSLFLSGFLEPESLPKLGCNVAVLRKPVGLSDLHQSLEEIVGQPPAIRGNK